MPKIVADRIDWIKLGFILFAKDGISGIVVDKMANKLKCNRSSFYWHFDSKEKFIDKILTYWIETDTNQIIEQTQKMSTAEEKFKVLIAITFKSDPNIDFIFHLKRYAIRRKDIQKTIDEIDEQRISFVSSMLEDLGYSEGEALTKAKIFYKYLIGYHEMIKYKKQHKNYVADVYHELKHFINI
ncbi:TetR/AcrR family transcriptional regulator [Marinoscillum sp.]|uniref:TetR/AcrR family transcriptional regulator n=1 Tax=Marinoscillum sp. TaxID=2024838 RepID=UPI003BA9F8AA